MIIQNYKTNLKEKHNLWLITQHSVCSTHIFEWFLSISISKECLINNIVYFKKAHKSRSSCSHSGNLFTFVHFQVFTAHCFWNSQCRLEKFNWGASRFLMTILQTWLMKISSNLCLAGKMLESSWDQVVNCPQRENCTRKMVGSCFSPDNASLSTFKPCGSPCHSF